MIVAAIRRAIFKPSRYAVPVNTARTTRLKPSCLGIDCVAHAVGERLSRPVAICTLVARRPGSSEPLAPLTLAWLFRSALLSSSAPVLVNLRLGAYLIHDLTFFAFLCFLPLGKHFHVVTSIFNVYFAKLDRGTVKPVRWGVANLDEVKSFGVKNFEDFTWKHMLDFYSCADCGRCSDNCPANAVGRPLSPRFISIKARDYSFRHDPGFRPGEGEWLRTPPDRRHLFRG